MLDYTVAYDATDFSLPLIPLFAALLAPAAIFLILRIARGRREVAPFALKLALWAIYLSYLPAIGQQYWALWQDHQMACDPVGKMVAVGRLDGATGRLEPAGIFVSSRQALTVDGTEIVYQQRTLRFLDFLIPRAEYVPLPLVLRAHVRITYRDEPDQRRLLKFEVATRDIDGVGY